MQTSSSSSSSSSSRTPKRAVDKGRIVSQEDSLQKLALYKTWKEKDRAFGAPQAIIIPPTGRCNLRCSYCVHSLESYRKENYGNDADEDSMLRIVREGVQLGVKRFTLTGGGEPFLRPSLTLDMMREIKLGGAKGEITTNRTLLTKKAMQAMVDMRWDLILFSIDSHDQETADDLRGKKVHRRVVEKITKLNALKKKKGSQFPALGMNVVLTKQNFREIPDILRFAADLKVWTVIFIPVTIHSPDMEHLRMGEEEIGEMKEIVRKSITLMENLPVYSTNLHGLLDTRITSGTGKMAQVLSRPRGTTRQAGRSTTHKAHRLIRKLRIVLNRNHLPYCFAPWSTLVIHHDGSLNPCQHNSKASQIQERHIEDAWYQDDYLIRMRNAHHIHELPDFCQKCCSAVVLQNQADLENISSSRGVY